MRIAIDAHALGSRRGGDETYIRNLVQGLAALQTGDDYTLLLDQFSSLDHAPGTEHMRPLVIPQHRVLKRIPISIPLALIRERIDVVHMQYVSPPLCPSPAVVSVHDIAYERYPQFFTPGAARHLKMYVALTIHRAAAVLTLSEFSKCDIVRRYRVPPEKVVVTYLAANPAFRPLRDEGQLAPVRERYGTGERFILCVGNLQPRKNLKTLIEAYIRLRRAGATRHKLVLVGKQGWLYDEIFAVARASGYAGDLVFTGYVPDDDLVALYNAAEVFVYPSIFEGFGLPPLEAMACGTPVVCSDTSSFPEVVGDAALTVDPLDPEALARAIASPLRDPDLRARLSAAGVRRAGQFSWENTARTVLRVYRSVSQGRHNSR